MNNQIATGRVDNVTSHNVTSHNVTSHNVASHNVASQQSTPASRQHLIFFALLVAVASLSVHGFWRGILPLPENGIRWVQLGVLAALWASTYLLDSLRAMRGFVLVNVVLHTSTWLLFTVIAQSSLWTAWFGDTAILWRMQVGEIILKTVQMLAMIGALLAMGLRREDFYLVRGQMDAPVEPVRWLGIRRGTGWLRLGLLFGLSGTLLFMVTMTLGFRPVLSSDVLWRLLPIVPVVLLLAALNAAYEEVVFKAAPLSQLEPTTGKHLALWITAASFGLCHFTERYFLPGMSVLLPALLGYMLSKSMLETRGLAWAWIIHFSLDVVIFSFIALATVTAVGA